MTRRKFYLKGGNKVKTINDKKIKSHVDIKKKIIILKKKLKPEGNKC